jgi:D-alanyl-D-alanine carboxypeptidase/D-alanyl-D-alanine-endopeptidase (penicillin-binding protein 4)
MIDSLYWGPGWSWDDNPYGYQPYLSPLMLCGGAVEVVVKPTKKDSVPDVITSPQSSFYSVVNEAVCGNEELGKLSILRDWLEDSNVIRVRGNCVREKKEKMNMYR